MDGELGCEMRDEEFLWEDISRSAKRRPLWGLSQTKMGEIADGPAGGRRSRDFGEVADGGGNVLYILSLR